MALSVKGSTCRTDIKQCNTGRQKLYKLIKRIFVGTVLLVGVLLLIGNLNVDKLPLTKSEKQLRIISMNVSENNILPTSLQDNLIQTQADIVVVIEWTGDNLDLHKFTQAGYETILNHPKKGVHGLCILSKLEGISTLIEAPIKTPCRLPLGQFRFSWNDSTLTLFAVHAPPPVPSCKGTTSDYILAIADWVDDGKLNSDIGVGKQGDHLILAGDFNSISMNNGIEKLRSKNLNDAHSKYNLISPTWKPFSAFPFIAKIDYIFFSNKFETAKTYRFRINNSDHLGLITDINF